MTNWITSEILEQNHDLVYGQIELGCSGNQTKMDDYGTFWEECFAEVDGVIYSVPVVRDQDGDYFSPDAEGSKYLSATSF